MISLAVGEGLVEITNDHVAIVTDMAVPADNIDEAKAEEARQRAAARLQRKTVFRGSRIRQRRFSSLSGAIARQATPSHILEDQSANIGMIVDRRVPVASVFRPTRVASYPVRSVPVRVGPNSA